MHKTTNTLDFSEHLWTGKGKENKKKLLHCWERNIFKFALRIFVQRTKKIAIFIENWWHCGVDKLISLCQTLTTTAECRQNTHKIASKKLSSKKTSLRRLKDYSLESNYCDHKFPPSICLMCCFIVLFLLWSFFSSPGEASTFSQYSCYSCV